MAWQDLEYFIFNPKAQYTAQNGDKTWVELKTSSS
jgi:hypothetical protein